MWLKNEVVYIESVSWSEHTGGSSKSTAHSVRATLEQRHDSLHGTAQGWLSNTLEAVAGIDAEAEDSGDFHGLIVAHRGLEFPGAQGG